MNMRCEMRGIRIAGTKTSAGRQDGCAILCDEFVPAVKREDEEKTTERSINKRKVTYELHKSRCGYPGESRRD